MVSSPQNLGRAYLVKQLQERGLSRRMALRILNTVFAEMAKTLKRGRWVEFPCGKLRRVEKYYAGCGNRTMMYRRAGRYTRWSGSWTKRERLGFCAGRGARKGAPLRRA
jgi:hypothetical protein